MLLPIKSKNPPESLPIGTVLLIVANLFIFGVTVGQYLVIREPVIMRYGLTYTNLGPKTVLSSMFLHLEIFHILGNMWFLYLFGFAVEGRLRTAKFLAVYFAAGIAGGLLHVLTIGRMHPDQPAIGASGAIMGILGAALYMFPFGQVDFFYWFGWFFRGVFTAAMWAVGLLYLGMDMVFGFLLPGGDGTAHLAHLGGAAAGFLVCALFFPKRDTRAASDAKAMFSETKDLRTLSAYELASMASSNPNDTTLALNWMDRSMREGKVSRECHETFMRLLPVMVGTEDIRSVGFIVASIATAPGQISPIVALDTATRLERAHEYATALRLYDAVLQDARSGDGDREAALFRSSILCESALGNKGRAMHGYQEIMRLFPMSPFADQARARLQVLSRP